MSISVTTSESGPVHVIHVVGEVDVTTAGLMRDALEAMLADGHRRLTLDLAEVTFMDSTALGVIVGRLRRLSRDGGTMTVVATHERVLRVFGITGLDQLMEIHPELDAAVAAAQPAPS